MNSRTFEAEIKRCETLLAEKSFSEADEAISTAVHINQNCAYAWYLKAKVCIGLLNYKKALRACKKAISIDRKNEYIKLKENLENFLNLQVDDLTIVNYPNKIDNMVVLTNGKNIGLLSERILTKPVYKFILDSIREDAIRNAPSGDDIFMKVRGLAENYIDLKFVENSSINRRRVMGAYGFKRAAIETNGSKTLQIASMIHELAHHLLFEIFKNTIMYVYQSRNTDTIEALGWYALTHDVYWLLMNEYCAHAVECHYMKLRNYESFNFVLEKYDDLNRDKVKRSVELGNSLAGDIIYILDGFFTKEMVEEIRLQFLSDRVILLKKDCEFESEVELSDEEKFSMINSILRQNLIEIKINFSYNELNQFKKMFEHVRG